jgi:hypothetical protein
MDDNNIYDELNFIDLLAIVSFILQLINYKENMEQSTNDDLFRELQKQDKVYFKKILKNQEKTLGMLSEIKDILT